MYIRTVRILFTVQLFTQQVCESRDSERTVAMTFEVYF